MALRNQPYFPLYVNDFLSDEKLILCSAESTGVYIRIMCLMHKSDEYGVILLKQKFKQNTKQSSNFASQLAIFLPYTSDVIERSIDDLVENNVLHIDGDRLIQTRMVKDEKISQARAFSGSKGGKKSVESRSLNSTPSVKIASSFAQPNIQANTEYVNEDKDDSILDSSNTEVRVDGVESNIPIDSYLEQGEQHVNAILDKTEKEVREEQKQTRKKKTESDERDPSVESLIDETIAYLNAHAGKHYLAKAEPNREFVRARIKDGYGFDDFKFVIENQWREWSGTSSEKYMRPETLFNATKFQSYINAPDYSKQAVPKYQNKSGRFEQIDFDKIEV